MDAPYTIDFDEARSILIVRAEGFWSRETLAAFGNELLGRINAVGATGKPFTVLADASAFPVQSVWVSTGFIGIVHRIDRKLWVPTAIVATRALLRLQALRVLIAPHIRIFSDMDAALAWLAESGSG